MKFKKEELIELAKMVDEDFSTSEIVSRFNCCKSVIEEKIRRYKLHGIEGILHKKESYSFTPEFKMEIINRYYAGESKNSLAAEINVSHSVIYSWVKKYEQFGYNCFEDKRGSPGRPKTGRPSKNEVKEDKIMAPLTDLERKELNKLRERNRRLEMELKATKKLRALVQERINRQTKKKQ